MPRKENLRPSLLELVFCSFCCREKQNKKHVRLKDPQFRDCSPNDPKCTPGSSPQPSPRDSPKVSPRSEVGGSRSSPSSFRRPPVIQEDKESSSFTDYEGERTSSITESCEDRDRELVDYFAVLADRIECKCKKYPRKTSGSTTLKQIFFDGAKERRIAVMPSQESCDTRGGASAAQELKRWRHGVLGWWLDTSTNKKNPTGMPPKGFVELRHVCKVRLHKDDHTGCSVKIKHREKIGETIETFDLILKLDSKRQAEEWECTFDELLRKLFKSESD